MEQIIKETKDKEYGHPEPHHGDVRRDRKPGGMWPQIFNDGTEIG